MINTTVNDIHNSFLENLKKHNKPMCDICYSTNMVKFDKQDGPDDFVEEYICLNCRTHIHE